MRGMMKRARARLNITSVVGSSATPAKSTMRRRSRDHGLDAIAAREIAAVAFTVNCVAPGFIDTDIHEYTHGRAARGAAAADSAGTSEIRRRRRRGGFLASPQAAYTGATLHVNGGMYMS